MRTIIYGVYEHLNSDTYLAYYQSEERAIQEMKSHIPRIQKKYPHLKNLQEHDNKITMGEKTILAIHPIVVQ